MKRLFEKLSLLILINSFLISCGGGGGNSEPSISQTTDTATIPTKNIFVKKHYFSDALVGKVNHYIRRISVEVSNEVKNKVKQGSNIYFYITHTNSEHFKVYASIENEKGYIYFDPQKVNEIIGSYEVDVTIQGCYDKDCNNEFGKEQLTYQLNVRPSPITTSAEIIQNSSEPEVTVQAEVDFVEEYLNNDQWDYKVKYLNSPTNWLFINKATEGSKGVLNFTVDNTIQCGIYKAVVEINIDGISYSPDINIPVTLILDNSTPSLIAATPVVQYKDEKMYITLRGCGLKEYQYSNIPLKNLEVIDQKYKSPFELEVVINEVNEEKSIPIEISGHELPNTSLNIEVVNKIINIESIPEMVGNLSVFDGINQRYYQIDKGKLNSIQLINSSWEKLEVMSLAELNIKAIDLSPEGKKLLITTPRSLFIANAATYEIIDSIEVELSDPDYSLGSARYLNNSQVVMTVTDYSSYGTSGKLGKPILLLDLTNNKYLTLDYTDSWTSSVFTSSDKSTAFFRVSYSSRPNIDMIKVDLLNGEIVKYEAYGTILDISRNGDRVLLEDYELFEVVNKSNNIFELPLQLTLFDAYYKISDAAMTSNGEKIYATYKSIGSFSSYLVEFNIENTNEGLQFSHKIKQEILPYLSSESIVLTPDDKKLLIFDDYYNHKTLHSVISLVE